MGHPATGSHAGLARRAHRQHGLFTLEQVLELGFTRPYVRRRLDEGAWARHRRAGVQSIGNLDPRDVTTVAGVRATAPALTLIVLATS
jgi:putative AbiEi antitoxin of type IV toxin-antitoxin system